MNFFAVVIALALEQWRTLRSRVLIERFYVRYLRTIETKLNGGTTQHGIFAAMAALAPPVLVAGGLFWALHVVHPGLGFLWNIACLYFLMGFRRFSHAYSEIVAALKANNLQGARRALAAWRGSPAGDLGTEDITRLAIERGLLDSYVQVFATLFWFAVLPGPVGAVLYRATSLVAREWRAEVAGEDTTPITLARDAFGRPARTLLWLLDWVPVRLTALSFAIVGDFEDAVYCWRTQSRSWSTQADGEHAGIILASGAGALGVQLGGTVAGPLGEAHYRPELGVGEPADTDLLPSAVGLVWRALVLWLLLILLLTLANWAP
ncbi:MAG: CobD/CbiB family protein [Pseudomonadota bacterium]|nr:CobD/CbiB family protein [Pseudomonadota bacterium]